MFWWSVPVGFTGLLILGIAIVVLVIMAIISDEDIGDGVLFYIFMAVVAAAGIGFIMAVNGFFFWALGEIWGPYF